MQVYLCQRLNRGLVKGGYIVLSNQAEKNSFSFSSKVHLMEIIRMLPVIGAVVAGFLILRKVLAEFGGPSRKEQYRQLEEEFKKADNKITGPNTPRCPLCGGDTERFQYPHLRVWRCVNYPTCRGFVKATKGGTRYGRKWHNR